MSSYSIPTIQDMIRRVEIRSKDNSDPFNSNPYFQACIQGYIDALKGRHPSSPNLDLVLAKPKWIRGIMSECYDCGYESGLIALNTLRTFEEFYRKMEV